MSLRFQYTVFEDCIKAILLCTFMICLLAAASNVGLILGKHGVLAYIK